MLNENKQPVSFHKFQESEFLSPPIHHFRKSIHYWIGETDFDNRVVSRRILQWQPHVQAWCHSDMIATGSEIHLDKKYNFLVAPVAEPDLESNKGFLLDAQRQCARVLRKIQEGRPITNEDRDIIKEALLYIGGPIF